MSKFITAYEHRELILNDPMDSQIKKKLIEEKKWLKKREEFDSKSYKMLFAHECIKPIGVDSYGLTREMEQLKRL